MSENARRPHQAIAESAYGPIKKSTRVRVAAAGYDSQKEYGPDRD